jgi:hypothetical protein
LSEHIRRQNALSGKGFGFSGLYTAEGRWVYDWLRFEKSWLAGGVCRNPRRPASEGGRYKIDDGHLTGVRYIWVNDSSTGDWEGWRKER